MRSLCYRIRFRVGLLVDVRGLSTGRGLRRSAQIALTNIRGSLHQAYTLSALYECSEINLREKLDPTRPRGNSHLECHPTPFDSELDLDLKRALVLTGCLVPILDVDAVH